MDVDKLNIPPDMLADLGADSTTLDDLFVPLSSAKLDAVMMDAVLAGLNSSADAGELLGSNTELVADKLYVDAPEFATTADPSPSWLAVIEHETSYDSKSLDKLEALSDGNYLDISNALVTKRKLYKRKRKQELTLRKHDRIEFIDDTSCKENIMRYRPLRDVQNTISQKRCISSFILDELTAANMKNERKEAIARKLDSPPSRHIQFTEMEECDILQRASMFLDSVEPDPRYCIASGDKPESLVDAPQSIIDNVWDFGMCNGFPSSPRSAPPQSVYTINAQSYLLFRDNKFRATLPLGSQLLKPSEKLVELVAHAIDESPDGLLQVQQVYNYIMLRYPYFAFMDKVSTSSWRSSIRHALYQKWFRKIAVSEEKISSKGCFWAINRQSTPREWTLPSQTRSPERCLDYLHTRAQCTNSPVHHCKLDMVSVSKSLDTLRQYVQEQNGATKPDVAEKRSVEVQAPPISTQPVWQPSVQYTFGRPARPAMPYHHSRYPLRPAPYPLPAFRYPRRPFLPRPPPLLPRQPNAMAYRVAAPYALPSSNTTMSNHVATLSIATKVVSTVGNH